jgi:hypothetical protein
MLDLQLTLGHPGHYCLIDSVTSTDPTDPYRKPFIPVSVLFYLYHLFYATTEHHVYSSLLVPGIIKQFNLFYAAHISLLLL